MPKASPSAFDQKRLSAPPSSWPIFDTCLKRILQNQIVTTL
jgi:hypothetical protein